MELRKTDLAGVYVVDITGHEDARGLFARTWDPTEARGHGLCERFDYSCISTNGEKYTLRGMHFQREPHGEAKLVRCTKGAIFDVAIDLRLSSPTFRKWCSADLSAENHRALYIPPGCAHGFLTLEENSEVLYCIGGAYVPDAAAGVRFDDPAFAVRWPSAPAVIVDRDRTYPDFSA